MIEAKPFTRRRLLAFGGAAAATAILPGGVARAAGRRVAASTNWLDRATFTARIGQSFTMTRNGGGTVGLTLLAVSDLAGKTSKNRTLAGRADAFMLTFKRAGGGLVEQGTRTFRHAQLGSRQLFVVPGTSTYTVIVNHSE
jgi:hypothetical protein